MTDAGATTVRLMRKADSARMNDFAWMESDRAALSDLPLVSGRSENVILAMSAGVDAYD